MQNGFSQTASGYKINDLGELPYVADDVTVSLNRDGLVAYWTKTGDTVHATLWQNGTVMLLGSMAGYPNSIAHALNKHGDIAGWMNTSRNLVDSMSTTRGFIQRHGRVQIVAGLGGRDSRVLGVNDKGLAVGSANLPNGVRHAFVTEGSQMRDLGTLPFGTSSAAYAINNAGVIVGISDVNGIKHAAEWKSGKIFDLGAIARGTESSALAINDRRQIAGFTNTPEGIHAFLYKKGVMQDLGTLGSEPSTASGINNHGEIVGASNLTSSKRHAFLWRKGHMIDLNDMLPPESKWILLDAFSINDHGQVACSASRRGEPIHLLLLTPM